MPADILRNREEAPLELGGLNSHFRPGPQAPSRPIRQGHTKCRQINKTVRYWLITSIQGLINGLQTAATDGAEFGVNSEPRGDAIALLERMAEGGVCGVRRPAAE